MKEQIVIGVRGPKGEKIEVLEMGREKITFSDDQQRMTGYYPRDFEEAMWRAWTRYKKIKK